MKGHSTILEVENLKTYFPITRGFFSRVAGYIKAVDGVSFSLRKGETLGLVGESGCGKSTVARTIIRLLKPTGGSIRYCKGDRTVDIAQLNDRREMKELRKDIQIVFQDPHSSLDSRMTVRDIIAEPLKIHRIGDHKTQTERVIELLERVGLNDYHANRYPHEFSGGQRQRIGIARALALDSKVIICDEPVSALDVSVQAQIINLLRDLQKELGLTYLFIAHDLSVVEHVSNRVAVMYVGRIVELADSHKLYGHPRHPYTEALLQAIPIANPRSRKTRRPLGGGVPDPASPPSGCRFHPRCPYARDICSREEPALKGLQSDPDHLVACHYAEDLLLSGYACGETDGKLQA